MKKLNMNSRANQSGFTLIELIVVMVILGIMAATALPKFADLGSQARVAKMNAALAAIKATSTTAHAADLAGGSSGADITMEGTTVSFANGYPTAATIAAAAGLSADYTASVATGTLTVTSDADHATCKITYAQAASAGATPTISAAPVNTDCD